MESSASVGQPQQILPIKRGDLRDLSFLAWGIFAIVVLIVLNQSIGSKEGRDFVYFYAIGDLLNHHSPGSLYDYDLQKNTILKLQPEPLKAGHWGLFAYPPHLAMLFQPIAMMPFWTAFRLWISMSAAFYLTGIWLLTKRFCGKDRLERSIFFWFGLVFWPFISWMLMAGQLSAIGFLAMALALYWEGSGNYLASGAALSICTYKPTLLLLVLPMLLVMGRLKTLAGFAGGALALFAAATAAGGTVVWTTYVAASARYASGVSHVVPPTLDLRTIAGALPPARGVARILVAVAGAAAAVFLVRIWWKSRTHPRDGLAPLVWATTVTWTLLLNVYVPVYDSVQVVLSLIATAAILIRYSPRIFCALCAILLAAGFPSTWLAEKIGWQILTPVLIAVGLLQLFACSRAIEAPGKTQLASAHTLE